CNTTTDALLEQLNQLCPWVYDSQPEHMWESYVESSTVGAAGLRFLWRQGRLQGPRMVPYLPVVVRTGEWVILRHLLRRGVWIQYSSGVYGHSHAQVLTHVMRENQWGLL